MFFRVAGSPLITGQLRKSAACKYQIDPYASQHAGNIVIATYVITAKEPRNTNSPLMNL